MVHETHDPIESLAEQIDRIGAEIATFAPGSEATRVEFHAALVAMVHELRERRAAETALRHSEGHFRSIVERLPDVVAIVGADYRVQYASPSLATALGRRPEDAVGQSVFEILHEEDAAAFREIVTRATERPASLRPVDVRGRHADGSWRVFEVLACRLGGKGDVLLGCRDVSARRREEERLRNSEERHVLAVRGGNDGLWDWDLVSDSIAYSDRWKEMVGARPDASDRPEEWFGRVHPEDLPQLKADLASHIEGRVGRFDSEHRIQVGEGRHRWMLSRGLAVRRPDGTAVRLAGVLTDITDRKAAEQLLAHQAAHDALTGLPNRSAFLDRLERSISRATMRKDYLFAVLFLDVDRFKLVNDSLGHLHGDQLLVGLARRLVLCVRPSDLVAHAGGDEFAILADHMSQPNDASFIADRIQRSMAAPFRIAEQDVFATVSTGIALSTAGYERPDDVLRDADAARYRAKGQGGGRYEMFDRQMQYRALARLQLETDLRRAVERGELRLHYQAVIGLGTGEITGFEALIRWQHPERGLVSPGEFVPVAEETGLIIPISNWVVGEGCRQVKEWQERLGRRLSISINLTSTHFTDADVMKGVERALAESGLAGADLMIEITESAMMKDMDAVVVVLNALKSCDIGLHIDDFGTGYSSLSYLHSLPTDALKIDKSFVARMGPPRRGEMTDDGVMVKTIIEMAHNLGRHVIAEGIETREQFLGLKGLGCEFGQGYYFSKPLPPDQVEEFVRADHRWE